MDPTLRPIPLSRAFPELVRALRPADRELALVAVLRDPRWEDIGHSLALAACRRRERVIAELVGFPPAWLDRELCGDWGAPARPPGERAQRVLRRAGLLRWRDVVSRTPGDLLARSGAGLVLLADTIACAIELSAIHQTRPDVRSAAAPFGVAARAAALALAG